MGDSAGLTRRQIWAQPTTSSSETYQPGCTPYLLPSEGMSFAFLERFWCLDGFRLMLLLDSSRICSFESYFDSYPDTECGFRTRMYRPGYPGIASIRHSGYPRPILLVCYAAIIRHRLRDRCQLPSRRNPPHNTAHILRWRPQWWR